MPYGRRNYLVTVVTSNTSLLVDTPADLALVVIPLHMLWRVRLPPRQRRLILTAFSASMLCSLADVIYAVFNIHAQIRRDSWSSIAGVMGDIKARGFFIKTMQVLLIPHRLQSAYWSAMCSS